MRFIVSKKESGLRLDLYLARHLPFSRSSLKRLIKVGKATVNREIIRRPARHLSTGEEVRIDLSKPPDLLKREDIPLKIHYEDEKILVVSKPAGMITHPTHLVREGTLVNALLARNISLSSLAGLLRPGIVHRLDKETSGLLVIAKDNETHARLAEDLKARRIKRRYLALVYGLVKDDEGEIDLPIGRAFKAGNKMRVLGRRSREARTCFRVLERFKEGYTLLGLSLFTGRTHQIRVHLSHIGHPVVGDSRYGRHKRVKDLPMRRLALHAWILGLYHPETGEYLELHSEAPDDLSKTIGYLRERELESMPTKR